MKKKKKNLLTEGFTYLEILITISILAIIAIGAYTNYIGQIKKGHDSNRKEQMAKIKLALEDYYMDNDCYPSSLNSCDTAWEPYLHEIPCDPEGIDFQYEHEAVACPQHFCLFTNLENTADLAIENVGCQAGCGSGGNYNWGLCSENIKPTDY